MADVGNLGVHNPLRSDLGVRGKLSAPTQPNARFLLQCRPDGDFKAAGARRCIFLGNGNSVRDYDKLSQ
jgi:hypothetical protein